MKEFNNNLSMLQLESLHVCNCLDCKCLSYITSTTWICMSFAEPLVKKPGAPQRGVKRQREGFTSRKRVRSTPLIHHQYSGHSWILTCTLQTLVCG